MAPLTALTSLMKSEATDDPEFNWWDKTLQTRRLALTTTINTAVTTLVFSGGGAKGLKDGDLLLSEESNEVMLINGDPTADTSAIVVRGYSGTTPAAITVGGAGVNPNFRVIGSAYEEGSNAPTGVNFDPTKRYNYTQIFRNALEATRTAMKTRLRTGDAVREAKRECLEIHTMDMEMAFWFGERVETTRNGKPLRTTGGIINWINDSALGGGASSYDISFSGGTVSMDDLDREMEDLFSFGSSQKMGFCGNRALTAVNQAARKNSTYNIQVGVKEFGMTVTRLVCPYGELTFKTHPLFNQMTGGTTGTAAYYGMNSTAVILDMENFKYRHLTDSDTKYEPKLQANDLDGLKSGYMTEAGLEVHHPRTHRIWRQMNAGIQDT
jgi:hypothetical protein